MDAIETARRAIGRVFLRMTFRRWLTPAFSIQRKRRRVSVFARAAPVPQGTRTAQVELGGVAAERVELGIPDPRRAILLMHSGGFTVNDARGHRSFAALLSRSAAATVFSLDYRLAPEHPYPAALEDTLAAYEALSAQDFEPAQIAFAGDSAGANLCLAAAMHLRDAGRELPAALLLMCPQLDLTNSGDSHDFNEGRDSVLSQAWARTVGAAYAPGGDLSDPGVSPLFGDLTGLPPIHLQSAGEDLLLSDAERLEQRARSEGLRLEHRREPGIWHDFQAMPSLSAAGGAAIRDAGEALRRIWEGRPFASEQPAARVSGNGASPNGASAGAAAARPRVAIIGAGFGGVGLALRLQRAGIEEFTIFDRADSIGGTWLANTYPGAACDVPAHVYSMAIEPNPDWSRAYAPQSEILAYLQGVAERHGIDQHARLGTEIARADYDEGAGIWRLETTAGEQHEAEVLVSACGQLSRPSIPPIEGTERFRGEMFHSAEWNHDFDLEGREVAVIGTGASAIQFVPRVAERAGRLKVFQRSAHYVVPKLDPEYPPALRRLFRLVPPLRLAMRLTIWSAIEFFGLGFGRSQAVLAPLKLGFRRQLAEQVPEGELRDALTPGDAIGCKRILFSSEYFPTFTRPNVELRTEPIREITERGIVTADGAEHPADAIIWGTGFKTTQFLTPMRLFGRGGRELNDAWRDGAHAYLGITVSGFPNFFLMYGPNTNSGSASAIHTLESSAAYILDAVETLRRQGGGCLELRAEVGEAFDREMQERLAGMVWSTGCSNWYVDEAGRNSNNWPGLMSEYRRRTRRLDPADYRIEAPTRAPSPVA